MKTWNPIMAAAVAAGLCAGQAWGATIQSAESGMWTNGATWAGGVAPGINDVAIITNGCTVTMNDMVTRSVSNLTIQAGGVLTHTAHASGDSTEKYKVILNIVSNLTIDAGGAIDVATKGYSYGGLGTVTGSYQYIAGAGHGGQGGPGLSISPGGTTYGSVTAPTNIGSSACRSGWTGPGGGAVILTVGNAATVNGTISANGGGASPDWNGCGSGGSVFIRTKNFTGSGTLTANGYNGGNNGGSGGGRIAVILTGSDTFGSVVMQSYGGTGRAGAAGTIYLEKNTDTDGQGELVVDNGDRVAAPTATTLQNGSAGSSLTLARLTLRNAGVYAVNTNVTLNISGAAVTGDPADGNEGLYVKGGTLTVPAAFVVTNYFVGVGAGGSTFSPATSLTVGTNASLVIDQPHSMSCPVTVASGGVLTHTANDAVEAYKIDLSITGNLTIDAGGKVDVNGIGYTTGGPGGGLVGSSGSGYAGGGSYGGVGAQGWAAAVAPTYGSITAPTNIGSGANTGQSGNKSGGGAAILSVTGTTTLNGLITANGSSTSGGSGAGSGSGGSVYLTTGSLTGSGTIFAKGATAPTVNGSGGGGRIAVVLTGSDTFGSVTMHAYGGSSAAAGTIYRQTSSQGAGQGMLLVDAGGIATATGVTTLIHSNVTGTTVGMVVITNTAVLALSNQILAVQGNWENKATFIAQTNSTVDFAGTNTATIWTNNTFFNLTCTNAGKTLSFEAGKTNTVTGLLKLGAARSGQMVTLQSTVPGSWSYLTLVPGGTQAIARVNVKDNNAGGGQTLLANVGSANGGNNINWQFPPSGTMFVVK